MASRPAALTSKSNRIDAIAVASRALFAALKRATGMRTVLSEQIVMLDVTGVHAGGRRPSIRSFLRGGGIVATVPTRTVAALPRPSVRVTRKSWDTPGGLPVRSWPARNDR